MERYFLTTKDFNGNQEVAQFAELGRLLLSKRIQRLEIREALNEEESRLVTFLVRSTDGQKFMGKVEFYPI